MLDVRFWVGLILSVAFSGAAIAQSQVVAECEVSATTRGSETFEQRKCLLSELEEALSRVSKAESELERITTELERVTALEESVEAFDARQADISSSLEGARAELFETQTHFREQGNSVEDLRNKVQSLEANTLTKENSTFAAIHAAAGGACLALGAPVSGAAHITIPRRARESCSNACKTHPGNYANCRGMVAIGLVLAERPGRHTDAVNINYRYSCADVQDAYDVVRGDDRKGQYTAYCCCYR